MIKMNLAVKLLLSILFIVVGFIPTLAYIALRWLMAPEGFWQELILTVIGIPTFGLVQLMFLILLVPVMLVVWEVD